MDHMCKFWKPWGWPMSKKSKVRLKVQMGVNHRNKNYNLFIYYHSKVGESVAQQAEVWCLIGM